MGLLDMEYVDKDGKLLDMDAKDKDGKKILNDGKGIWEFKHRILGPLVMFLFLPPHVMVTVFGEWIERKFYEKDTKV